jgi:hypothetical protein
MRSLLLLVALGSVAHAGRVVVLTDRTDLSTALQVATAAAQLEIVTEPMASPQGEQVLDRAATAQHLAVTDNASAVVWIDGNEVWAVSADGHELRHAPLADASDPRVFAAIAASLLDELRAPPENATHVRVDVTIDGSPQQSIVATPTPPPPLPVVADVSAPGIVVIQPRGQRPSPRLDIAGGPFVGQRGMGFQQDPPDFPATPPSYPNTGLGGVSLHLGAFPHPEEAYGNDLTGFGATFDLQKSIGAQLAANDTVNDTYGNYTLDFVAWDLAAHYRHKAGKLLFDGMASYGRAAWTLESDFPASVQIPDTTYTYLGAGGKVELAVGDRSSVGFGARYMYILSSGDVSDEDWYGSGTSSGLGLDVDVKIPISDKLYVRGTAEYRRVSMNFVGDGNLATSTSMSSLAVSNITDSWLIIGTEIGATF